MTQCDAYYSDEHVTLYHGDCLELMPRIREPFITITDPPYGVTDHKWDVVVPPQRWMTGSGAVVTASEPYATQLICQSPLKFRHDSVWVKNYASNRMNADRMPMRRHERILVFGDPPFNPQMRQRTPNELARLNKEQRKTYRYAHPDSVIEIDVVNNRSGERTEHASQKPVPLMEYLIRTYTDTKRLVVDPFAGSGTTLLAARNLGRKAIGVEIEERYCELIASRLAQGCLDFGGEAS